MPAVRLVAGLMPMLAARPTGSIACVEPAREEDRGHEEAQAQQRRVADGSN